MGTVANIERGFQSINTADHVSAIALCAKAIRDNPFPSAVNAILLRLVDIFQGDKPKVDQSLNSTRLRIVKLLKECNLDTSSAQDDPIVRCIMKVSHSNDYKARSLAMLFLAAIAPVVHANKKIHYLLLESLDCNDLTELTSTIIAVGSVGRLSSDFAAIVVTKIGAMLLKDDVDLSVKVRLMEDLSSFKQRLEVTNYCMDLGKQLLTNNSDLRICVAVICALTEMAKQNGLGLGEYITLILKEVEKIKKNETLMICCLTNLMELAQLPHHWNSDQVLVFFKCQANVCQYKTNKPMILWLQSLNFLVKHIHESALSANVFFDQIAPLAQVDDFTVKIHLAELLYSRLEHDLASEHRIFFNNLLSEISSELRKKDAVIRLEDRIKFYTMMTSFVKTKSATGLDIDGFAFAEFLMTIDNTYNEQVFLKSLETLNLLCESDQGVGRLVCNRSINILRKSYGKTGNFLDAPIELYSLALQPFTSYKAQVIKIVASIQEELTTKKRWWFAFKLARLGLRYGHWSDVALPLLEKIQGNCDTIEVASFIMALIHIAKAQLPVNFDITTLNDARRNIRNASLLLTPLVQTSRNSESFVFAADYINCLYELFDAFSAVMISLNSNKNVDVGPKTLHHMAYTKFSMDKARAKFSEARKKWTALQQRSFDADEHTQQHLELFARYCQLFESVLFRVFASDFTEMAPIVLNSNSIVNYHLEQIISWGINQANESIKPVTGTAVQRANAWKNNFDRLSEIFACLNRVPLCLPRSFFQQIYQTKVKLNVMPQPKEREQALTLSSKQLALSVEGFIETTNPKRIQKITVYVRVCYADKEFEPLVDSRTCDVCDNYFFKVNFLLSVVKNAEISTNLAFMDSIDKRTWQMGTLNQFQVIAPENH